MNKRITNAKNALHALERGMRLSSYSKGPDCVRMNPDGYVEWLHHGTPIVRAGVGDNAGTLWVWPYNSVSTAARIRSLCPFRVIKGQAILGSRPVAWGEWTTLHMPTIGDLRSELHGACRREIAKMLALGVGYSVREDARVMYEGVFGPLEGAP